MQSAHNYYVYILECSDGFYYTGVTNNLDKRIWEHNEGINKSSFTYNRRPVVLKYFQRFQNIDDAILFEKQIKGWNRKKKEALFNEDWNEIMQLSSIRKNQ
jgi:putative endonuclease